MVKVELQELREIQYEILETVANFCAEKGIEYFLTCGTLLGAVKYKGYIPWDDDIDIGMLRPEYEKFMNLFNDNNIKYKSYSIENNSEFLYPFGKVLDTETILFEPDLDGMRLSINIDIKVYDNAPDDDRELNRMFNNFKLLNKLRSIKISYRKPRGNFIRRTIVYIARFFLKLLPEGFFDRLIVKNATKMNNVETSRVGNFVSGVSSGRDIYADRSFFEKYVDVVFETRKFKAPARYHEWLTIFYGNYLEDPPLEKQISHHSFVAFKKI